jgi:hypothetical protein
VLVPDAIPPIFHLSEFGEKITSILDTGKNYLHKKVAHEIL